ncbi:MAG: hypothetical protein JST54_27840 [Deltaproteobacteria bacterium]|nr:hypothetical protein [Deltaproteobacteria bacterium]
MKLALGLLIVLVLVFALARSARADDKLKRAAAAAQLGDASTAQALIAESLARSDPQALLIAACDALNRAKGAEARVFIQRLEAVRPGAPEVAVLKILAAQSDAGPEFHWLNRVVAALPEAKLAQLSPTIFTEPLSTSQPLTDAQLKAASGNGGFLVRLGAMGPVPSDALIDEALELSKANLPPSVAIAVITVLTDSKLAEARQKGALAAARQLLQRTAEKNPGTLYLQVWSVLLGTSDSEALSASELDALEKAVTAQDTSLPMPELFDELERAYERLPERGSAYELAWNTLFKLYPLSMHVVLLRRVKATATRGDAAATARAAHVLAVVGRAFTTQRSIVELNIGRGLLSTASELTHDGALAAESGKAKAEFELLQRRTAALRFIASFPFAGITRDLIAANTHGEIAFLARLPNVP